MMEERYLPYVSRARWAISREFEGEWLALVQDDSLNNPADAAKALRACGIEPTFRNLERYFPSRVFRGRCPTLEFLELFSKLGNGHKKEVGV